MTFMFLSRITHGYVSNEIKIEIKSCHVLTITLNTFYRCSHTRSISIHKSVLSNFNFYISTLKYQPLQYIPL